MKYMLKDKLFRILRWQQQTLNKSPWSFRTWVPVGVYMLHVHEVGPGPIVAWSAVLSCYSRVWLFETPWTIAHQASLSVGFPRQKYWSELPFPSPGDLPDPGIRPESLKSPALAGRFFTTCTTREVLILISHSKTKAKPKKPNTLQHPKNLWNSTLFSLKFPWDY